MQLELMGNVSRSLAYPALSDQFQRLACARCLSLPGTAPENRVLLSKAEQAAQFAIRCQQVTAWKAKKLLPKPIPRNPIEVHAARARSPV